MPLPRHEMPSLLHQRRKAWSRRDKVIRHPRLIHIHKSLVGMIGILIGRVGIIRVVFPHDVVGDGSVPSVGMGDCRGMLEAAVGVTALDAVAAVAVETFITVGGRPSRRRGALSAAVVR